MATDWRKVLRWLKGFGIFFILIGVFVIVYDTIYSLPDREGGLVFIGIGLILFAVGGMIRRE